MPRLLNDRGATAVEYAIMVSLIAVVVVVAVVALGQRTSDLHQCSADAVAAGVDHDGSGCP